MAQLRQTLGQRTLKSRRCNFPPIVAADKWVLGTSPRMTDGGYPLNATPSRRMAWTKLFGAMSMSPVQRMSG